MTVWSVLLACATASVVCRAGVPPPAGLGIAPESGRGRNPGPTEDSLFGQKPVEGFSLLLMPAVQKELRMTRGQVLRITARDQAAEGLIEGAIPPPKQEEIPALWKKQEEIRAKAIAEILDARQQKRLLQILAQQQGAALLLTGPIEQALKLSDTQRYVLYSIHQETINKVKELKPTGTETAAQSAARQAKLRKIRLAGFNHMLRALTAEQRKQLRALLGPPLKLEAKRSTSAPRATSRRAASA